MQYGLGTEKGGVGGRNNDGTFKTVIQNETPFTFGAMSDNRANYTSERIVESFAYADATDHQTFVLGWKAEIKDNALVSGSVTVAGTDVTYTASINANGKAQVVLTTALTEGQSVRIGYVYDNVTIPQDKLPTLVGRMAGITLEARARRIAVYYSQIAAYQAKQDYGVDFESTIAQQAQAELSYEIDTEGVYMIRDAADAEVAAGHLTDVVWYDEEVDQQTKLTSSYIRSY